MLGLSLSLGSAATLNKGGRAFRVTDSILGAGGADYAFWDSSLMSSLFQDEAGTAPVTAIAQSIGRANARRKLPHYGSQSVNNSRPALQADGMKFDGSDDNLLSDWLAQAGANCIVAQVSVPLVVSSTQVIAGAQSTGRLWLAINSAGQLRYGVGSASTIGTESADLRGRAVVVGLVCDGSTVRMFEGEQETFSAAQTGSVPTSVPLRIGANNTSGTAGSFFGGSVAKIAFGRVSLTLEQFRQIRTEWLEAA